MLNVNIIELRKNLSKYIRLSSKENINIINNGEVVAVLSSPDTNYYHTLFYLCGCLDDNEPNKSYDDMIGEEILKRCGY